MVGCWVVLANYQGGQCYHVIAEMRLPILCSCHHIHYEAIQEALMLSLQKKRIFQKRTNLNSNLECNNKKPKKRRCILCRYNFVLLLLHFVHLKPKTLTELQIYSLMWYHMGPLGRTKKDNRIWQLQDHISLQNILFQNTSGSTYCQCNEYIGIYEKMTKPSLHFFVTLLCMKSHGKFC